MPTEPQIEIDSEPLAVVTADRLAAAPGAARPPRHWVLVRLGRVIGNAGLLSLPLAIGAIVGFYAADQGMRWLPSMLELVLVTFLIGFVAMPLGRMLQGEAYRDSTEKRRLRRRIVVCMTLATACVAGRLVVFWMQMPSSLTALSEASFNTTFAADSQRYREFDRHLEQAVSFLEKQEAMFASAMPDVLTADQEGELLQTWAGIYDLSFALDQIRLFYEDWYRFDPSRAQRSLHLRSYLLTYAAELALYEKSLRLVQLVSRNPNAVKFLDAPHPAHQLEADSFSRYRQELQGTRDEARVLAGERYLDWLASMLHARPEAAGLGCGWLWDAAEKHLGVIHAIATSDRQSMAVGSDLQVLKQTVRRNWYPAQSSVAEWMGDTRVRRIGHYMVTASDITHMLPKLQPGDIMLSRKNWYLSNVGLPGFWPHAILYIGEPQEFRAYFDVPEVLDWVEQISGKRQSLPEHLLACSPSKWIEYEAGQHGEPCRVIEAISEGVVFNTMEHACGDYLAVLRPRLSKLAKAQAIIEAFGHLSKPYDYEFDFATDHALVCTELVWRSYRPAMGKAGLTFPLVDVMGRRTLPANEIASRYAAEAGQPQPQIEFVYFLDASEARNHAFVADETAFRASAQRTKWDLALD